MNTSVLQSAITARHGVTHVTLTRVSQASARQQVRKRRSLLEVTGNALACLLIVAIVDIALINFFLFPDCNRVTRDCFLVENLWGAK